MPISIADRRTRYTVFVLLALTINVIDSVLTRTVADPGRRALVAAGASLDVVIVVSLLYYWLLVRPGIRARGSLVAIALLGVLHATFFYPSANAAKAVIAGLCELGLIGFVVIQVRRNTLRRLVSERDPDPVDSMQTALQSVLMAPFVARMMAAEFSVLYYALFSWRAKPHVPPDAQAFSLHKRGGQADLLGALAIASVMEIAPVHLVLHRWSPPWAWIVTGLSVYAAIWLLGLARSMVLRPVLVRTDYLDLRYGLVFRLRVPREMIASVRRAEASDAKSAVVVPSRSEPNVCIELVHALDGEGPFGIRKRVDRVAVTADEGVAFERALAEFVARHD